ncbi:reverse transcriptase domain-containing protein [Tanacetum coccineum]
MPAYANPNSKGLFPNPLGLVTSFIRWIEDYPLPDGLKMPSHIGSYDGKGDPDNFLHLFEGTIRMQKWLMPVACHMFTYTLKDSARIWWNSQKTGIILDYEDLKAKFRSHFSQQKKFTKTHLAVHNIKQRENENLPLTYKGLMEKTYTWVEAREVATNGVSSDRRDSFERPKKSSWDNNRGQKNKDSMAYKEEITFPPVTRVSNASVIIEAAVFRRKVGRVYMDSESTCEVIYEHCFEKLNPIIKATRVNMKTPLVGFSGKRSWFIGEVPLEITIGEHPLSRIETLNFVIVKSDSPYNMLLGRTAMQKMGIVVLTIHGAIKFYTKKGVGTALSIGEAGEETKKARKTLTIGKERIPSCDDTEEKIVVNDKYPEQMVTIGKQLPEHFKKELQNLLRDNADIFTWTHADMTGIPRTIMVDKKPFNTEHKLNNLKNTGATYQRLVDKVFSKQIRINLEAYVDDMVIKSTSEEGMLSDIQETFERFWSINMKLNPKKCSFGVEEGPFLGHLITKQGIKANPSKIKAVTELEQPRALKDI